MSLIFKSFPKDEQLATLEPNYYYSSCMMEISENEQVLRAGPGLYSLPKVAGCLAIPIVPSTAFTIYLIFTHQITEIALILLGSGFLTAFAMLAYMAYGNRNAVASCEFFVLDKVAGTLDLPRERERVILSGNKIERLILLHGTYLETPVFDLVAIVPMPDGSYSRYTIFRDKYDSPPVVATKIASALKVPLQQLKVKELSMGMSLSPFD